MKKSLIALAVLATTGVAMAQSSVTLYGRIDTSIGSTKLNGVSTSQVYSGNLTTSRYGFRGTEDLGGGLKANFVLENGFNADDGTLGSANTAFNRQAWVGLSGGFGALKLGKTDSVYKDIYDLGNAHNVFDSEFTATKEAYRAGLGGFTSRPNNQIRYETPNMGGFSAGLTYALDEDVAANAETTALNLRYSAGNLAVGVAYQEDDFQVLANDRKYTVLAGTYNFGVAKVSGQLQNIKAGDNRKDTEFALGVSVPVGNVDLSAGYARSKAKDAAGADAQKGTAFSLGATYGLSKRTKLYGGYIDGEVETAAGVSVRDYRLFALGVRHDF
ncbi:porin [Hydrogenophaga sp.]|uniref:porin n=1 Tax=Hydrogenophaga sp. TaxID=1904254 RepID=UPI003D09F348